MYSLSDLVEHDHQDELIFHITLNCCNLTEDYGGKPIGCGPVALVICKDFNLATMLEHTKTPIPTTAPLSIITLRQ